VAVARARAVGVNSTHDAVADVAQLTGLGLGQWVNDETTDRRDVSGRGGDDLASAAIGENGQGVAAVGGVGCAPWVWSWT
jgi:hypothetical protein